MRWCFVDENPTNPRSNSFSALRTSPRLIARSCSRSKCRISPRTLFAIAHIQSPPPPRGPACPACLPRLGRGPGPVGDLVGSPILHPPALYPAHSTEQLPTALICGQSLTIAVAQLPRVVVHIKQPTFVILGPLLPLCARSRDPLAKVIL